MEEFMTFIRTVFSSGANLYSSYSFYLFIIVAAVVIVMIPINFGIKKAFKKASNPALIRLRKALSTTAVFAVTIGALYLFQLIVGTSVKVNETKPVMVDKQVAVMEDVQATDEEGNLLFEEDGTTPVMTQVQKKDAEGNLLFEVEYQKDEEGNFVLDEEGNPVAVKVQAVDENGEPAVEFVYEVDEAGEFVLDEAGNKVIKTKTVKEHRYNFMKYILVDSFDIGILAMSTWFLIKVIYGIGFSNLVLAMVNSKEVKKILEASGVDSKVINKVYSSAVAITKDKAKAAKMSIDEYIKKNESVLQGEIGTILGLYNIDRSKLTSSIQSVVKAMGNQFCK